MKAKSYVRPVMKTPYDPKQNLLIDVDFRSIEIALYVKSIVESDAKPYAPLEEVVASVGARDIIIEILKYLPVYYQQVIGRTFRGELGIEDVRQALAWVKKSPTAIEVGTFIHSELERQMSDSNIPDASSIAFHLANSASMAEEGLDDSPQTDAKRDTLPTGTPGPETLLSEPLFPNLVFQDSDSLITRTIQEEAKGVVRISYLKATIDRGSAWYDLLNNPPSPIQRTKGPTNNPFRKCHTEHEWAWRYYPEHDTSREVKEIENMYDPEVWTCVSRKYRHLVRLPEGMTGIEAINWAKKVLDERDPEIFPKYFHITLGKYSEENAKYDFLNRLAGHPILEEACPHECSRELNRAEFDAFLKARRARGL